MSFYADANATYPVLPSHYDEVAALLKSMDGNPSSIHAQGRAAKVALENARAAVAMLLGARATEICFTSGATEANNFALQGLIGRVAEGAKASGAPLPRLIVSAAEHSSVLEPSRLLAERGLCELTTCPVGTDGRVDIEKLLALVNERTALVGVMHANNEVGAINDVETIARRIKEKCGASHVHVDGVQMLGKADLTWYARSLIDSAAFSAHKIGGYKGTGALFLKAGTRLNLLIAGGGQERGRRPGTENMPGILSFGICAAALNASMGERVATMSMLRDAFLAALAKIDGAVVHGSPKDGLPNTVNFHVEGLAGDDILLNFDLAGVRASSGSACSSGVGRPSHVLTAMGLSESVALNSVRASFSGRGSLADVAAMVKVLETTIARVRRARA